MAKAQRTFERRQLGLAIKRLRAQVGVSQQVVADAINRSRSRIVEVEEGTGSLSVEDLANLLDYFQVSGDERETMVALGVQARRRRRRQPYVDALPNSYQRFADLEASASRIDIIEPGLIPGLLQTQDYMRAIIEEGDGILWAAQDTVREDRIAFRMDRQAAFFALAQPPELRIVLTEESLRADLGQPDIMRPQLEHIIGLSRPGLAVRAVRHNVRGNPLRGRALVLFGFEDRVPVVGYSEAVLGPSSYYDDEAHTAALGRAFDRVWGLALTESDTKRFVRKVLEEL
jgi:transcriptional regulator with XRE-family HTH domain